MAVNHGRSYLTALVFAMLCLPLHSAPLRGMESTTFRLEQHFSTKTPYSAHSPAEDSIPMDSLPDPAGCKAAHMWLLSRHGTRWPTLGKVLQTAALDPLLQAAGWASWQDPWGGSVSKVVDYAGELHPAGEEELRELGGRLRRRYPSLFGGMYYNPYYPINATQVPRTSASAAAFAQGAFPCDNIDNSTRQGRGVDSCRHPQPVAVYMAPKNADVALRFYDICPAYDADQQARKAALASLKEHTRAALVGSVGAKLGISVNVAEVDALWNTCTAEAGLFGLTNQTCSLFDPEAVKQLEWSDDVEFLEGSGWGSCIAYRIAGPLLGSAAYSLQAAAEGAVPAAKASLNFAHAETIAPLASLLGLFGSPGPACNLSHGSPPQDVYKPPLPRPPSPRPWKASTVAPFGANLAFVMYQCPAAGIAADTLGSSNTFLVRTLYNEAAVKLPGCGAVSGGPVGGYDCPLEDFLESVVGDLGNISAFHAACQSTGSIQ